mmetsp:Transcript_53324/g.114561  ORF Transcript_53324/g.114561 Transcript_53324/m.114561 type:complete len:486 (+) Transcript_53324:68-1525(+)
MATQDARRPAILVLGGAFCPVHCGHVTAMEVARSHVEAQYAVNVVAGYFACAPSGYVTSKYKGRAIPAAARLEMCNTVAREPANFLRETPLTFGSARACADAMKKAHHSPDTQVFIICGADKLGTRAKPGHVYISRKVQGVVAGVELVQAPEAMLHISATQVRQEICSQPLQQAVGELVSQGIIPDVVGKYMLAHPEALAAIIDPKTTGSKTQIPRGRCSELITKSAKSPSHMLDLSGALAACNVYVVRHGERMDEVPGKERDEWRATCGSRDFDPPLTGRGHLQALSSAKALRAQIKEERPFDVIHSSPMQRCVSTAELFAQIFNVPIHIVPGLAECSAALRTTNSRSQQRWNHVMTIEEHRLLCPGAEFVEPETLREQYISQDGATCIGRLARGLQHVLVVTHREGIRAMAHEKVGVSRRIPTPLAGIAKFQCVQAGTPEEKWSFDGICKEGWQRVKEETAMQDDPLEHEGKDLEACTVTAPP